MAPSTSQLLQFLPNGTSLHVPVSIHVGGDLGAGCALEGAYRPEKFDIYLRTLAGSSDLAVLEIEAQWKSQIENRPSCGPTIMKLILSGKLDGSSFEIRVNHCAIGVFKEEMGMGKIGTEIANTHKGNKSVLTGPTISIEMARGFLEEFFVKRSKRSGERIIDVDDSIFFETLRDLVSSQIKESRSVANAYVNSDLLPDSDGLVVRVPGVPVAIGG